MKTKLFLFCLIFLADQALADEAQTQILRRVVNKINLKSTFPSANLSVFQDYDVEMVKIKPSHNFKEKFYFIREKDNIYFLSTALKPSILKVNLYFNSTFNNNVTMKKVQKRTEIKDDAFKRVNVFEFRVHNSIEDILKAEKPVLDQFQNRIWKPKNNKCKSCLSVVYIRPESDSYAIGVGSPERHSELLEEYCFLDHVPQDFLGKLNLNVVSTGSSCYTTPYQQHLKIVEEYTVNAIAKVGTKEVSMTRMFAPEQIEEVSNHMKQIFG